VALKAAEKSYESPAANYRRLGDESPALAATNELRPLNYATTTRTPDVIIFPETRVIYLITCHASFINQKMPRRGLTVMTVIELLARSNFSQRTERNNSLPKTGE
jgi:hypothetical protein